MALSYQDLTTERQWRGCTGVSKAQFENLSILFSNTYEKQRGYDLNQLSKNLDVELSLPDYKSCLFFVLYALKSGVSFDILSFNFGMSVSATHKNFKRYLSVLKDSLEEAGHLPKSKFSSLEAFQKYMHDKGEVMIDVSELAVERPQDNQAQQEHYSGKKSDILSKH
jgi:hypothetical protein